MIPYKTSKDYNRLKELLDEGKEIVIFLTHKSGCGNKRICFLSKKEYEKLCEAEVYHIGEMTVYPYCKESFKYYCEKYNIEFIEPNL